MESLADQPQLMGDAGGADSDVADLRALAEAASRRRRYEDAEDLLTRCLELAPGCDAARYDLAALHHRRNKATEALSQIEELLARDPRHPGYLALRAAILARLGEDDQAIVA